MLPSEPVQALATGGEDASRAIVCELVSSAENKIQLLVSDFFRYILEELRTSEEGLN